MTKGPLFAPIVQIDAFTQQPFGGNPAAVMPLLDWPHDGTLQAIAAENNLAETAFIVREGDNYRLRWFTPTVEIDLCGHATLASGHYVMKTLEPGRSEVTFLTKSGPLHVRRDNSRLVMDFPSRPTQAASEAERATVARALGQGIIALQRGWVYFAELADEDAVRRFVPDMNAIQSLPLDLAITARGSDCDFVSRFFAPKHGIPEDPVTGSTHCSLGPYWGARLGKNHLFARQVSARGGEIWVGLDADRVSLAGYCVEILSGTMLVAA